MNTRATLAALDLDEQAIHWCMRLAEKSLSVAERRDLQEWLRDPRHRAVLEEAIAVWEGVEAAADRPEMIQLRSRALDDFRGTNRKRWARRMPGRWRLAAVAASVVAIAAVAGLFALRDDTRVYVTNIGERRVVKLEDGTQLSLDAATHVQAGVVGNRRTLQLLSGRAKFDVAKDPLRPFSVTARNKVIVATGTSFSVELLERQVRVVLYEGHVEVLEQSDDESSARPLRLRAGATSADAQLMPGRELLTSMNETDAAVVTVDVPRSLSWESGQLNFVDEPLGLAVERMNRYSRERLMVDDARVAAFKVNGVFNAGDVRAFIEAVQAFAPVSVEQTSQGLVMKGAPPANQ